MTNITGFTDTLTTPLDTLQDGTVIAYGSTVALLDNHAQWWITGDMNAWGHEEMSDDMENYGGGYKIIHRVY